MAPLPVVPRALLPGAHRFGKVRRFDYALEQKMRVVWHQAVCEDGDAC
jgi:hypothetical protein